jgi:hypothetical protein
MKNETPVACSLNSGELTERLAAIAEVGASCLISRRIEGESRVLRFHKSAATRERLEGILAAEAECCPFLDLSLHERDDELVLSIAASEDGRAVADGLALAFGGADGSGRGND